MRFDTLLTRPARQVEPGLWSVLAEGEAVAHYDRLAGVYDVVVASGLYNRVLFGNTPAQYAAFAERALQGAAGPVLDAGCGSLVFTHRVYERHREPTILIDRSLAMLRRARGRLPASHPGAFLQADLYDLPFPEATFDRVLHFAIAHVLPDRPAVFRGLHRVLRPGGSLWLTSLVTGTPIGDRWLGMLHRAGEVSAPYSAPTLLRELAEAGFTTEVETRGSGAYVVGHKRAA